MPTYQFRCPKCNKVGEITKHFGETLTPPVCKNDNIKMIRIYTPIPVIYKGSGFYSTDKREGDK